MQRVLGQHLHHAAVARQLAAVGVLGQQVRHPDLLADLIDRLQAVRGRLVRAEHAEVGHVVAHHVAQELAQRLGVLVQHFAGLLHLHRVVAEIRQLQLLAQQAAVGVRVGAHAARARGASALSSGMQPAVGVEQLLGLVAAQPVLEQLQSWRDCCARPRTAPGANATSLRSCGRRSPSGPSSPWASAARSSASAGARRCRLPCAPSAGWRGSRAPLASSVAAMC